MKPCRFKPLLATAAALLVLSGSAFAVAQDPNVKVNGSLIEGPADPGDFTKWLNDMKRWRREQWIRMGYDDAQYARPELLWTQSSYMQPQMMVEDRYFYDPATRKYTVDRYLDDLNRRYGGIDAVLIWPTYPNIGIDSRNQFDMFHDLPGGIEGIRAMVADFHKRNVRVLFPVMVWDRGTHDAGVPDAQALAEELAATGADGVNGDTMIAVPRSFRTASDKTGHPLAFEPEHLTQDEALAYNNMMWAQTVPQSASAQQGPARKFQGVSGPEFVDKYKWLETRHMTNVSDRWQRDKTVDLQYAFFNGVGMETWENIWGIWNGLTPRDAETVRRIAKIERAYAGDLTSASWEPHVPMLQFQAYASKWPGKNEILWTIINRNEFDLDGAQMEVPSADGMRYFDLWHGVELTPASEAGKSVLHFNLESHGYGAIVATREPDAKLKSLLAELKVLSAARLDSFSNQWTVLPQTLAARTATRPATAAPEGMVRVAATQFMFKVQGVEIEGGNDVGVDFQYPWENTARRGHQHTIDMNAFYIDKYPVTNKEFKKFVDGAHYHPADDHNFLRDWKGGTYQDGWDNKPVTWISLEDAEAYAVWAGKRLPHEWEWQLAAEGTDGREYPWGSAWDASMVPKQDRSREATGPDNVDAHHAAASPYGVEDLVGNVWQWTDEYSDEHTRAAVLRGGSYYKPTGSLWYFPQAYGLHEHGKYLSMSPGRDRAATIGFRCVVDAAK